MRTILTSLNETSQQQPDSKALIYLEDGKTETAELSYQELLQQAQSIAVQLQAKGFQKKQLLLLYPTGPEFIIALLACWYANAIAVPLSCPRLEELHLHANSIKNILEDAEVSAVMTLSGYEEALSHDLKEPLDIIASDRLDKDQDKRYTPIDLKAKDIAYLQYTSGSTSAPKAAIITHGNLTHSLKETIKAWSYSKESITLHWAPHTHVYGLVCGLLVPLYNGTPAILMPPSAFIKEPLVWLSAISSYRATHSGCPNFAYDLCVAQIKDEALKELDLKSWKVAVNGGDMVQKGTLRAFSDKFSAAGFQANSFCSAYGMSEVSGLIASTLVGQVPDELGSPIDRVSSGYFIEGLEALVVDPESQKEVSEGETGEIWLAGPSVAKGYWRRPEENKTLFEAKIKGRQKPYFRTGDLGVLQEQSLYLTGRLKEVMVVYGKKYYPLDFETTIAKALTAFQVKEPQVVFSDEIEGQEKIMAIQEMNDLNDRSLLENISNTLRHAIRKAHGVDLYQVYFCSKGCLPKTASGKLQRKKAQQAFNQNELQVVCIDNKIHHQQEQDSSETLTFKALIAGVLNIKAEALELKAPVSRYSFDSINILQLASALEEAYHCSASPADLYEFQTLEALFHHMLQHQKQPSLDRRHLERSERSPDDQEILRLAQDDGAPLSQRASDTQNTPQNNAVKPHSKDIAIIGMSGLFPDAPDLKAYWSNLYQGKDSVREIPADRWSWQDKTLPWGAFIDDIDAFDAAFFNISPHEAELMDPQQRLFLQTVWNCIEDAGYSAGAIAEEKTGLYVGVFNHDYAELLQDSEVMDPYLTTAAMNSMIANRISYVLNLRGPSETIDTACSSSLVAIHHAVRAIWNGDCEMALAGGVNALLSPRAYMAANQAGMLSPDGHCKTFDKDANGYVRGEGFGAVLLKDYSKAWEDGDYIYGLIKGTAINHGGHANSLTAPNPNAQAELVVAAHHQANIPLESIQYIETHGTGTPLGDPIEINGLKKAFKQLAQEQGLLEFKSNSCALGAVKTQIGHLESAAGIAGLIKILLAMQHQSLPGNLHFNELNPYIDFQDSPFYIQTKTTPWLKDEKGLPRRAAISSFGFGGSNAHLILEEAPESIKQNPSYPYSNYLICLSAKSDAALKQRISHLRTWLEEQVQVPDLASLSFTLNAGRESFEQRFAVIVSDFQALKRALQTGQSEREDPDLSPIMRHYLKGKAIDWAVVYGDFKKRMPLPTYPFEKTRYWLKATLKEKRTSDLGYYKPVWIEAPLTQENSLPQQRMMLMNPDKQLLSQFKDHELIETIKDIKTIPDQIIIQIDKDSKNSPVSVEQAFFKLHELSKQLMDLKPQQTVQILCVFPRGHLAASAMTGFAKTLHLEQGKIHCRVIELPSSLLPLEELDAKELHVRYEADGKRYVSDYQGLNLEAFETLPGLIKKEGVYLITGGLGGLGYLFAQYLAERYQAHLILVGRSVCSEKQTLRLKGLDQKASSLNYIQADVANPASLKALMKKIKKLGLNLNGVIHSAGLTHDQLISNQTAEEMGKVLAPKVAGSYHLHQATEKEPLDFFVQFSSVSAAFGNRGQSDYAYANAYLDGFAAYRDEEVRKGRCFGQSLSINWPLWKDGGLQINPAYQELLKDRLGIEPLSTEDGLLAFETMLKSGQSQLLALPGEQEKLQTALKNSLVLKNKTKQSIKTFDRTAMLNKTEAYLKTIIAETLKLPASGIDRKKAFEHYGVDSLMIIALNQRLEKEFSDLPKTLFFEHANLTALTAYFVEHYAESLAERFGEVIQQIDAPDTQEDFPPLAFEKTASQEDPIAIIGLSAQFPQSKNLEEFWQHLIHGDDCISEVPPNRWSWEAYYGEGEDKTLCKWGGFIDDFDQFDPAFFNISAREANVMDPQQRLFLESCWRTIEDAGYNPFGLNDRKIGVFAGVGFSEYQPLITNKQQIFHGLVATGNSHSLIANRVSYFFNFHGPSEAVDTACSSSLVALNRAVTALRNGECEQAIAGGVSLILNPETLVITTQLGALSVDGRCKTFDKSANGFVKGEGVATVLLKPLSQAQRDGDHIYAVIRATAVNHGGKALSLTAPNVKAQTELLLSAYRQSHIQPETITYIETHGTGTSLGDPVEIDSLKQAFKTLLPANYKDCHIGLGSVKTNIGHLEPAAGMAGLLKIIWSMRHEQLPGLVHFKELNPFIELQDSGFYLVEKTQAWERLKDSSGKAIPLRAGVSSFGFGGSNAHAVIEEGRPYQSKPSNPSKQPYYLIALSARQPEGLEQKIADLRHWLQASHESIELKDLSFTLNAGKAHFAYRCALVVDSLASLMHQLEGLEQKDIPEDVLFNHGQIRDQHGPAFEEVYGLTMEALKTALHPEDYRKKLLVLADLYTLAYPIDWTNLYQEEDVQRIAALPVYPFNKQRYWYDLSQPAENTVQVQAPASQSTDLKALTLAYLKQVFAKKLQLPVSEIQVDKTYEVYGVDSVLGLEITRQLEQDLGSMPKTILYEKNRLDALADYLIKQHHLALSEKFNAPTSVIQTPEPSPVSSMKAVQTRPSSKDIAIIGIDIHFPMADSMEAFWQNLIEARDCVTEVPKERWDFKDYSVQDEVFPHGGFIKDVDQFDPVFFNIPPKDAALMDPQERLFLQSVWSLLEDAGYSREKLQNTSKGAVGVFAGMTYNAYPLLLADEWHKGHRLPLNVQSFSIANRVSYFLDLHGPSLVIDTACSSSLAAIHLACESLRSGESAMAIAGAVNLSLHPGKYHFLGSYQFMSKEGRCTSFAADGTGYVPSEGLGSVLLKPLDQAIADGDQIYGLIKGSSMNHGGKTSGYTVPNPNAQAQLILKALDDAQIDPRSLSYIEAHGTGTSLGDPIEIRGLQEAFEHYTQDKQFCAIGSVKSNLGHLEAAAGMPQLAKVLLQMRHQQLVPTIHTEVLNPYIDFEHSPFYVQRELSAWDTSYGLPRRAGISSFGAGGTNAHLILEEYQAERRSNQNQPPYLFVLSAFNEDRLEAYVNKMKDYLERHPETASQDWLADACFTLLSGREPMTARLAFVVDSRQDLLASLKAYPSLRAQKGWMNLKVQSTEQLAESKEIEALAKHWVNGGRLNWEQLFQSKGSILSLPTYPFAKRRCWIEAAQTTATLLPEQSPQASIDPKEWLYETTWEPLAISKNKAMPELKGKWLILSDMESGYALQDVFPSEACIYCFRGSSYEILNEEMYYIDPESQADYQQLFKDIAAHHLNQLEGIIYYCPEMDSDPSLSLLYAFQAMTGIDWKNPLRFVLLSHQAQQVKGNELIALYQHHLWSMARIFAAEQGHYSALLLDFDEKMSLQDKAQRLVDELCHYNKHQNHVAYRDGQRYAQRLNHYQLDRSPSPGWTVPQAALITGGLGALGYELAEFLVSKGCRYLLLTGTSPLSESDLEKNKALEALKSKGAQVVYGAVDVTDQIQMQRLITETESSWKRSIDGVFHLAGITTDNIPIAKMDEGLWKRVLAVKVKGSMVLHALFEKASLSSFVLFSSISAVPSFGLAGLSAYAAANEFMSGLALYRRSNNLPAISINWIAWSEKGMSHRYAHDEVLKQFGIDTLTPKEGMLLLEEILNLNPPEIAAIRIDWKRFLQVNAAVKQDDFFSHMVKENLQDANQESLTATNPSEVKAILLKVCEEVLGLKPEDLQSDLTFQDYGVDSIVGIQFTAALNAYFPDMISPMDLYRYPSVDQLMAYLREQLSTQEKAPQEKASSLDEMSYEELEGLLQAELKELELDDE